MAKRLCSIRFQTAFPGSVNRLLNGWGLMELNARQKKSWFFRAAQQGLDLTAKLLIDRGDIIVTENPTFLGALIAFNPYEPRYATVRIDENGMDMEDLERVLLATKNAKLLYTVPDFQNPTGVTMSESRRCARLSLQTVSISSSLKIRLTVKSAIRGTRSRL